MRTMDKNSLAHTKWACSFCTKYRRQVIYGKIKPDTRKILRKLCEYRGVEIHEANVCKKSYSYTCKHTAKNFSVKNIM